MARQAMARQAMVKQADTTLAAALWPSTGHTMVRNAIIVVAGSLLLTLAAKVKVPIEPVYVTMQPLAVLALALGLGRNLAVASVLFYLAQGAAGLPVFTGTPEKGIGLAYMAGPTAGYLVGFVLAATVTGWLADRGMSRSLWLAVPAAMIGLAAIYAPGIGWLAAMLGSLEKAVMLGAMPFVLKDVVGALIAGLAVPALWTATAGLQGR